MAELHDFARQVGADIKQIHSELVTAEEWAAMQSTVEQIKTVNMSAGRGAPKHKAPAGIFYTDVDTGDVYESDGK